MPDRLSAELAAVIWLRTLADLPSGADGGVATTLPKTPNAAGVHAWPNGFVVVEAVVSGPFISDTHRRRDRLLLTTHYLAPDTQRPRWHRSAELGEIIVEATLPNNWDPIHLTPAAPLDAYPDVYIHHVSVTAGPIRALGDAGNHARHRLTIQMDWHQ